MQGNEAKSERGCSVQTWEQGGKGGLTDCHATFCIIPLATCTAVVVPDANAYRRSYASEPVSGGRNGYASL